jgi:hypothetical protein
MDEALRLAKKMIDLGNSIEEIAKITGLSTQENRKVVAFIPHSLFPISAPEQCDCPVQDIDYLILPLFHGINIYTTHPNTTPPLTPDTPDL